MTDGPGRPGPRGLIQPKATAATTLSQANLIFLVDDIQTCYKDVPVTKWCGKLEFCQTSIIDMNSYFVQNSYEF